MLETAKSADVKKPEQQSSAAEAQPDQDGKPPEKATGPEHLTAPYRAGVFAGAVLCVATALIHVLLVFLHVAPPNAVSQQYSRQVNAWIFPLFEQNWRLFAPDPESVNRQISARTVRTGPDGTAHVSDWLDLSGPDGAAVEHNAFPSHTTQNLLRRAWSSYLETHGGDDQPRTERALMMQKYLSNIAADRVAARRGGPFDSIQLRVITRPIDPPAPVGGPRRTPSAATPADTRYLPVWKVAAHEH
ncbi:DUF5819 family protein [Streptomyces sp. NPDC006544]|uniref:DUF5819 family protein n=1 Tax=Streptomyces sp. NPDC006544 TaxID=3154583 RepID=UPI0033A20274